MLGGFQELRGQNFAIFWPPTPGLDSFYTMTVDKNRLFLTPSPPQLVHVVIECPLSWSSSLSWGELTKVCTKKIDLETIGCDKNWLEKLNDPQ